MPIVIMTVKRRAVLRLWISSVALQRDFLFISWVNIRWWNLTYGAERKGEVQYANISEKFDDLSEAS